MICSSHSPPITKGAPKNTYSNLGFSQARDPQTAKQFAGFFYSTPFDTARQFLLSGCVEWCHSILPHCRGPPHLKSGPLPQISENQEVCPMRQIYIRKLQTRIQRIAVNRLQQSRYADNADIVFYIKRTNFCTILLQYAEFHFSEQKLFLIRSAASGLTVILPNMDRMAGGELE